MTKLPPRDHDSVRVAALRQRAEWHNEQDIKRILEFLNNEQAGTDQARMQAWLTQGTDNDSGSI